MKREEVMEKCNEMQQQIIKYIEACGLSDKDCFLCNFDLATSILVSTINVKNKDVKDCLDEFDELTNKVFDVGCHALLAVKVGEDFNL